MEDGGGQPLGAAGAGGRGVAWIRQARDDSGNGWAEGSWSDRVRRDFMGLGHAHPVDGS